MGGLMERVTIVNEKRRRRLKPKDESRSVKKKWVSPAVTFRKRFLFGDPLWSATLPSVRIF